MDELVVPPRGRLCHPQPMQYEPGDVTGSGGQPRNKEEDPSILRSAKQSPGPPCGRRPQEKCFPLSLDSGARTWVSCAPSQVHPSTGDPVPPSICCHLPFGQMTREPSQWVQSRQHMDCGADLGCRLVMHPLGTCPPQCQGLEPLQIPMALSWAFRHLFCPLVGGGE